MYPPPDNQVLCWDDQVLCWDGLRLNRYLGLSPQLSWVMRTVGRGQTRGPVLCRWSVGRRPWRRFLRYSAYLLTVLSSSGLAIVKGSLFPALATLSDYFMHSIMPSNLSLCACVKYALLCVYVHVFKRHQQPTSLLPAGLLVKGLNKLWERDWDGRRGKRTEGSLCPFL